MSTHHTHPLQLDTAQYTSQHPPEPLIVSRRQRRPAQPRCRPPNFMTILFIVSSSLSTCFTTFARQIIVRRALPEGLKATSLLINDKSAERYPMTNPFGGVTRLHHWERPAASEFQFNSAYNPRTGFTHQVLSPTWRQPQNSRLEFQKLLEKFKGSFTNDVTDREPELKKKPLQTGFSLALKALKKFWRWVMGKNTRDFSPSRENENLDANIVLESQVNEVSSSAVQSNPSVKQSNSQGKNEAGLVVLSSETVLNVEELSPETLDILAKVEERPGVTRLEACLARKMGLPCEFVSLWKTEITRPAETWEILFALANVAFQILLHKKTVPEARTAILPKLKFLMASYADRLLKQALNNMLSNLGTDTQEFPHKYGGYHNWSEILRDQRDFLKKAYEPALRDVQGIINTASNPLFKWGGQEPEEIISGIKKYTKELQEGVKK